MDGGRLEAAPEGSRRAKRGKNSSDQSQADAWPLEAAHLAPAFRGLGPRYCLPRVHLKTEEALRSSPAQVWAQECGVVNLISVHKDGGVSSLPRIACNRPQRALGRQRSASDGERHRQSDAEAHHGELQQCELGQARWPPPPLVTKEQLLIERLRSHALRRSLLSLNSYSSSSQTSSSSPSDSLPSCSCCLANLRATNVVDPTSPCAFTEVSPGRPRKRRCSCNWWMLILLCSSSLIMLALGLLYLCETTHIMEPGVAEY